MSVLCVGCAKAPELARLLSERGTEIPKCPICGTEKSLALECDDNNLSQLFKALIRCYYREWDYNHHWGGVDYIGLLFHVDNPILNYHGEIDLEELDLAVEALTDQVYPDPDKGVSLFAGFYEQGDRLAFGDTLLEAPSYDILSISAGLSRKNFFLLEEQGRHIIAKHEAQIKRVIPVGSEYYRARSGYETTRRPIEGFDAPPHYQPYAKDKIGAPPPPIATPGRMNRAGVSFLYVASDLDSTIAELRPHPGEFLSVGQFRAKKDLVAADFTAISLYDFYRSEDELDIFVMLRTLDSLFKAKLTPQERDKYVITQFFADVIRQAGYDAVQFTSSVGTGTNLTVFDPDLFEYVPDSAKMYLIEDLKYISRELPVVRKDVSYFEYSQKVGKGA